MKKIEHMEFMREAIEQARIGLREGGIPIGSVLVKDGLVIGRGHNRRLQKGSVTLHAEMDCLENAGRLTAADYRTCAIYSTLSPCDMCTGAILLYKIPLVVIGENRTFQGPERYSRKRGVRIINLDMDECKNMMRDFIKTHSRLWDEDIGQDVGREGNLCCKKRNFRRTGAFWAYILQCQDGTYYTGYTNNLERRLKEHTSGKGGARYTQWKKVGALVWSMQYSSFEEAFSIEKKIKTLTRFQKEKLVAGESLERVLEHVKQRKVCQ